MRSAWPRVNIPKTRVLTPDEVTIMSAGVPAPTPQTTEPLDTKKLVDRLLAVEAVLERARADALSLSERGRAGGEVLYEIDAARRGLRRARELVAELTAG
jgi:hypothetical protein